MDETTRQRLRKQFGYEIAVHRQRGELKGVSDTDLDGGMALRAAYDDVCTAFETYTERTGTEPWNIVAFAAAMAQLVNALVDLNVPEDQRARAIHVIKNALDGKTLDQLFD